MRSDRGLTFRLLFHAFVACPLLLAACGAEASPLPPLMEERPDGWRPVLADTLLWEGFENGDGWERTDLLCRDVMWCRDSADGEVLWRCSFPGGGYGDNWLQFLTTPPLDIPARGPVHLRVEVCYRVEAADDGLGSDGMNVRLSADGGKTWKLLRFEGLPYDARSVRGYRQLDDGGPSAGWTGDSRGWKEGVADLSVFSGRRVQIRFACTADQWESGRGYLGWMVRSVAVVDSSGVAWHETADAELRPSCPFTVTEQGWRSSASEYHGPFQSHHCAWSALARHAIASPYIDLRNYRRASLGYWYLLDLTDEDGDRDGEWDDFYTVEVSADSGATWQLVLCDAESLRPGPGWCRRGADDVTTTAGSLLLDPWVGHVVSVRFVLRSDADPKGGGGLWLDDVAVYGERYSSLPGEVQLTELAVSDTAWALEIESRLTTSLCLGGWTLECDGVEHELPYDVTLPAGGRIVLRQDRIPGAVLQQCGGTLRLLEPSQRWEVDRLEYGTGAGAPVPAPGASVASVGDAARGDAWRWELDLTPTLGSENDVPAPALGEGVVRVVEVGLCPGGGDSIFVEVLNSSDTDTIEFSGWRVGLSGAADSLRGFLAPGGLAATWFPVSATTCIDGGRVAYLWDGRNRRVDQVGWESELLPAVSRGVPRGAARVVSMHTEAPEFVACMPSPGRPNRVLLPPRGGLTGSRSGAGVELQWPGVRDDVLGYNVYRAVPGSARSGPLNGAFPLTAHGFVDESAFAESSYVYWLEVVYGPEESYTAEGVTVPAHEAASQAVLLGPAEPNPFDRITVVSVNVQETVDLDVSVYGAGGRAVRTLLRGRQSPGTVRVPWDGTDEQGRRVPPGLYFCRVSWPGGTASARVLVLPGRG